MPRTFACPLVPSTYLPSHPPFFPPPISRIHLPYLHVHAEVLGFALPQFVSGRAHRALQRVAGSATMARQLRLREAHLLQPLAGTLLALWRAEQQQLQEEEACEAERSSGSSAVGGSSVAGAAGQPAEQQASSGPVEQQQEQQQERRRRQRQRRQSYIQALDRRAALPDSVLRGLIEAEVRLLLLSAHCFLHPCLVRAVAELVAKAGGCMAMPATKPPSVVASPAVPTSQVCRVG
jgi:hypothetical protein